MERVVEKPKITVVVNKVKVRPKNFPVRYCQMETGRDSSIKILLRSRSSARIFMPKKKTISKPVKAVVDSPKSMETFPRSQVYKVVIPILAVVSSIAIQRIAHNALWRIPSVKVARAKKSTLLRSRTVVLLNDIDKTFFQVTF